jgi:predicted ATPase with chaperone activity
VQYPAGFQLIAATNPCPCGCWEHKTLHLLS